MALMNVRGLIFVVVLFCGGFFQSCGGAVTAAVSESDVTAVIKTIDRPKCLLRLLKSLELHLPKIKVVVVDDGKEAKKNKDLAKKEGYTNLAGGVQYVAMEYDIGVAAGRNVGVSKVKTPYVLLMDDDFAITNETNVKRLVEAVSSGEADIAGGELYVEPDDPQIGIINNLMGKKKRQVTVSGAMTLGIDANRQLLMSKVEKTNPATCTQTDMISNFFVAKTETLKSLKWDDRLKLNEAEDFFLRAGTARVRVKYCPSVRAMHDGQCTLAPGHDHEEYKLKRERGLHFSDAFFTKHKIQQYSSAFGGLYLRTCAFGKKCVVAHMWKPDELKTCDIDGECELHKIEVKKHPETKHMRMYKCDASGKKCDKPVMD